MTGADTKVGYDAPRIRPVMTAVVAAVTMAVSVAALINTSFMGVTSRDLGRLRSGQWWRVASPVFVQSSGWGQLAFNMTGLVVVGAALERRLSRPAWILLFLVGGVGSVAVLSAWKPADGGGGSSDANAALIGALAVVAAVEARDADAEWASQLYSVFFATYLTGLAVGGVVPSIVAGDIAVAVYVNVRRACRPATVRRGCLVLIAVCGAVMTVAQQGHGLGIVFGIVITSVVLARKRLLARSAIDGRRWQLITAVISVVVATELVRVAWVDLVGVKLVTTTGGEARATVGWVGVGLVSVASCFAAAAVLRWLRRHHAGNATSTWFIACATVGVISLAGPLAWGIGATSRAGLISLHVTCAAMTLAMLAPSSNPERGPNTQRHGHQIREDNPGRRPTAPIMGSARRAKVRSPRRRFGAALSLEFADLVLPLAFYYGLRLTGSSVWFALVVPSIATGVLILLRWALRRRVDILSAFVLSIVAVSVALSVWKGSPRFLLLRGAVFTGGIAAVFLSTVPSKRPFACTLARGLVERSQIPTSDWDELWRTEPRFRRGWRMCTLTWGVGLLADAGALVYFAYRLPIDSVLAAATALRVGTFVVLQIITNVDLNRRGVWAMLHFDIRALFANDPTTST